jgi:hypothetical protein
MFRQQLGGCINTGKSPGDEIRKEQNAGEDPHVVVNRNDGGYTVSVEIHSEDGYYQLFRNEDDCNAAFPRHAANADDYP